MQLTVPPLLPGQSSFAFSGPWLRAERAAQLIWRVVVDASGVQGVNLDHTEQTEIRYGLEVALVLVILG